MNPSAANIPKMASSSASMGASTRKNLKNSKLDTAVGSFYNIFVPLIKDTLVFNSVSGALTIWDKSDLSQYNDSINKSDSVSSNEIREFVKNGYIVPANLNELDDQENRYNNARNDSSSLTLTVAPTMACNFGCDYCFQGHDKPSDKMDERVQDAFIKYLKIKVKEIKVLSITWYGGEPLLGLKIIESLSKRIIPLCKKNNVSYSSMIVTNGFKLDLKTAQTLFSLGITKAQITIDGSEENHDVMRPLLSKKGTYKKIVANMESWINEVPLHAIIRINIDERNKESVEELLNDLKSRGFSNLNNFGVYFAPIEAITDVCQGCNDNALGKRNYASLETNLYSYAYDLGLCPLPRPPIHHGMCQAIKPNGLLLLPTGHLHKCWDTVHDPGHIIGTIFNVEQTKHHPKYKPWVNWSPFKIDTCRNCKIISNCAGACAHKFINPDVTLGEGGSLPCPSWKFGIAQRLALRAIKMGLITNDDLPDGGVETTPEMVGVNHTESTIERANAQLALV